MRPKQFKELVSVLCGSEASMSSDLCMFFKLLEFPNIDDWRNCFSFDIKSWGGTMVPMWLTAIRKVYCRWDRKLYVLFYTAFYITFFHLFHVMLLLQHKAEINDYFCKRKSLQDVPAPPYRSRISRGIKCKNLETSIFKRVACGI